MKNETEKEVDTRAATAVKITVTGMPYFLKNNEEYYPDGIEYFHPDSGMVDGTWAENDGTSIVNAIRDFYYNVFGVYPAHQKNYLYYFFGAKRFGQNEYHAGVDVYKPGGGDVKSAQYGTVVYCSRDRIEEAKKKGEYVKDYGAVGIYNVFVKKTFYYLHMNIDDAIYEGAEVFFGTTLGTQGSVGADSAHLHFEVHDGERTEGPEDPPTLNESLDAIPPYPYM